MRNVKTSLTLRNSKDAAMVPMEMKASRKLQECSGRSAHEETRPSLAAAIDDAGGASRARRRRPIRRKPVTVIVPFAAGGATDTLARFLGEKMRERLNQPIIIENVTGAAGSIGVGRAVRAAADGYTLEIGTSTTHMLTGGLYALQFDLINDLDPIILIASEPLMIVGKKALPAKDLKELIAWLKAEPRQGDGRHSRRRLAPGISPASRSRRKPARRSQSCPIAATGRRCRTWSPARST